MSEENKSAKQIKTELDKNITEIDLTKIKESDSSLGSITDNLKTVFDETINFLVYLIDKIEAYLAFGNIKFVDADPILTKLETSVNTFIQSITDFKGNVKEEKNIESINTAIKKLIDIYNLIKKTDKVDYYDKDIAVGDKEKEKIIPRFNAITDKLTKTELKNNEAPPAPAPGTTPTPGAETIKFALEGEIDKATKQISKITSITIGGTKIAAPITTSDGKITASPELVAEFTKIAATKKGGRKRRTTAKKSKQSKKSKKRPRRKSNRVFQSRRQRQRRRATHAKITL
jgi:hypothetical protein